MSEEKRIVELDKYEHQAVVDIVNEKRNEKISKNEDEYFITEILQKIIEAPTKKHTIFKKEKQYER